MPHVQTRFVVTFGFMVLGCSLLYSRTIAAGHRFQAPGGDPHRAILGHRLPVRAAERAHLPDHAAPAARRCDRAVHHVSQRRGLGRHFRVHGGDHLAHANSHGLSVVPHDAHQPEFPRTRSRNSRARSRTSARQRPRLDAEGSGADLSDADRAGGLPRVQGRVSLLRPGRLRIRSADFLFLAGEEGRRPRSGLTDARRPRAVAAGLHRRCARAGVQGRARTSSRRTSRCPSIFGAAGGGRRRPARARAGAAVERSGAGLVLVARVSRRRARQAGRCRRRRAISI